MDTSGCSCSQLDVDGDGYCANVPRDPDGRFVGNYIRSTCCPAGVMDNCPNVANPDQQASACDTSLCGSASTACLTGCLTTDNPATCTNPYVWGQGEAV